MRRGPLQGTKDPRTISGKCLRKSEALPLGSVSLDQEDLYYHQAQTSSLSWGADEWFWTELFLVDTYFGSEENHRTYFTDCNEGDGLDPPLGGRGSMVTPRFDPREYFLLKVDRRIEQVATEYSALVETFDKRMEAYVSILELHGHSNPPNPFLLGEKDQTRIRRRQTTHQHKNPKQRH